MFKKLEMLDKRGELGGLTSGAVKPTVFLSYTYIPLHCRTKYLKQMYMRPYQGYAL